MATVVAPSNAVYVNVSDIVGRCRGQQLQWAMVPLRQRLKAVRKFRYLLATQWDALCTAVATDLGRPAKETLAAEILPLAAACRYLERSARSILKPRRVPLWQRPLWLWGQHDVVHRRPRGVVAIIGTWNYPLYLNGVQIMQAVAAGNAVLWKPSEVAPTSATALLRLFEQAGFPSDLILSLEPTRQAGQELAAADVDHIVFTGSDATGRRLAAQLGERLVSSSLELSGCDAMFVFEDADIDLAAKSAIFACTLNSGQTCLAARRVFVHTAVYSAFGQCLKSLIETVHPMEVALPQQKQQADRLVSAAVADGAQLFECRDESRSNENIPLRVVFDATPEMDICQEASFAPLTAVLPFSSVEAALAMEAKCRYGLGASIFTRDIQRAKQFAAQLRVGTVAINNVIVPTAHPATAVGGRGTSGWGVTQGREGLLEMTVPQTVSTQKSHLRMNLHMMAGTRLGSQDTILGLLQLSHSKRLLQRWRGLSRIVKALFKKDAAANRGQ